MMASERPVGGRCGATEIKCEYCPPVSCYDGSAWKFTCSSCYMLQWVEDLPQHIQIDRASDTTGIPNETGVLSDDIRNRHSMTDMISDMLNR